MNAIRGKMEAPKRCSMELGSGRRKKICGRPMEETKGFYWCLSCDRPDGEVLVVPE